MRQCPAHAQVIVRPYINNSSYFAHPELLLLTMLASSQQQERKFAVTTIRNLRNGEITGISTPRKFQVPAVNFEANEIVELINWAEVPVTEPLITASLPTKQIEACVKTRLVVSDGWQCHSQSIERAVKKVSESCLMVVGEKRRNGWIRCADASRKALKAPNTKADYAALLDLA